MANLLTVKRGNLAVASNARASKLALPPRHTHKQQQHNNNNSPHLLVAALQRT